VRTGTKGCGRGRVMSLGGRASTTADLGSSDGSDYEPKTEDLGLNAIEFCLERGRLGFAF
jgi:hypothetical protein